MVCRALGVTGSTLDVDISIIRIKMYSCLLKVLISWKLPLINLSIIVTL